MPHQIALLRGINVGGRNRIAMSDLRDLFAGLGFAGARSLLQSGNIVFPGDGRGGAALERLLEVETEKRLGVAADYIIRTAAEWDAVIAGNPFPQEAVKMPNHLLVMFLKEAPAAKAVSELQAVVNGPETIRSKGKHLYIVYPAGIGRSNLTNALIERKLDTRGTARNWNTLLKLAALTRA
jgi:uncharacterized protein (DUF1697 family)